MCLVFCKKKKKNVHPSYKKLIIDELKKINYKSNAVISSSNSNGKNNYKMYRYLFFSPSLPSAVDRLYASVYLHCTYFKYLLSIQ